jgi:peptidoglycan/LPS O-acetylase OafA/YrhL
VLLRLFPRVGWLEWIAPYSFTIYLWHPAANGLVRNLLRSSGLDSIPALFWIGLAAGVLVPVGLQRVMLRFPRLSLPVIGR